MDNARQSVTQEDARALCDAGYMPLDAYLELCRERGWKAEQGANAVVNKWGNFWGNSSVFWGNFWRFRRFGKEDENRH